MPIENYQTVQDHLPVLAPVNRQMKDGKRKTGYLWGEDEECDDYGDQWGGCRIGKQR